MAASKARDIATVAALYLALIAGGCICLAVQSQPTGYETGVQAEAWTVNDRPLLSAEQIAQARDGGAVAFYCAGKHYIAEGIPGEYLRED